MQCGQKDDHDVFDGTSLILHTPYTFTSLVSVTLSHRKLLGCTGG